MNHKYGRKKDSRAGCLLCKPHKANALVGQDRQIRKREAILPDAPRVSNGRFYDFCPDCNGTGRCSDSCCNNGVCPMCGGAKIIDFIWPQSA